MSPVATIFAVFLVLLALRVPVAVLLDRRHHGRSIVELPAVVVLDCADHHVAGSELLRPPRDPVFHSHGKPCACERCHRAPGEGGGGLCRTYSRRAGPRRSHRQHDHGRHVRLGPGRRRGDRFNPYSGDAKGWLSAGLCGLADRRRRDHRSSRSSQVSPSSSLPRRPTLRLAGCFSVVRRLASCLAGS